MPIVDIANETAKVGAALVSVPLSKIIVELAKGIAWGQYELDKVGVDITKMMGVPGTVNIGGESLSMLDAGFIPSFYHFVDTILELKMEVKIREEQQDHLNYKDTMSSKIETDAGVEVEAKVKAGFAIASVEAGMKAHYNVKATQAYSKTLDAGHTQQFSQELNASSLMRTKLVPKPAPDLLVERIKILLEKMRKENELEAKTNPPPPDKDPALVLQERLMDKVEQRLLGTPPSTAPAGGTGGNGGGGGDPPGGEETG